MQYEALCVFHPNTPDEKLESLVERFKDRIQTSGGRVENINKQGLKELASQFKKHKDIRRAHYVHFLFEGEGRTPNEFRNLINVTEEVVRHIITQVN